MNQRTLIYLLLAAFLGGAAAYIVSVVRNAEPATHRVECLAPELREQLKNLALVALDEAFKDQVQRLYTTWMKDDHDQPKRAQVGTQNAIHAYADAREMVLKFQPPAC